MTKQDIRNFALNLDFPLVEVKPAGFYEKNLPPRLIPSLPVEVGGFLAHLNHLSSNVDELSIQELQGLLTWLEINNSPKEAQTAEFQPCEFLILINRYIEQELLERIES